MSSSAGQSNVGARNLYESADQRTMSDEQIKELGRENRKNLRAYNTSEKQPPIDHQVDTARTNEASLARKDPTMPAQMHGNEPSRGAKIDAELKAEDEEEMRGKGSWGPNV